MTFLFALTLGIETLFYITYHSKCMGLWLWQVLCESEQRCWGVFFTRSLRTQPAGSRLELGAPGAAAPQKMPVLLTFHMGAFHSSITGIIKHFNNFFTIFT